MATTQMATASPMGEPINPWVMETGSVWIWGALVVLAAIVTIKKKKLPLFGLVLIARTSWS